MMSVRQEWPKWFRVYAVPLGIIVLALLLQLYRLDARTFHGDELGSVLEAQRLGLNANSLPYFALLRVWVLLGHGEFWLRSLSALAMVAAVAVTYVWVSRLSGAATARVVALLLATSPFLVVYGQQVRFYGVTVLAASLSLWAFAVLLAHPAPRAFVIWMLSVLFAVAGLLMNGLLAIGQVLTLFILSRWLLPRVKILVGFFLMAFGLVAIATPAIRQSVFNAVALYTNAETRYETSRGIGLANLVKIPMTYFFFAFGESVYPLDYALVFPGAVAFGFVTVVGLVTLWQKRRCAFWLVLLVSSTALGLLYLVFDPLSPRGYQGAAPRYLIFLLPVFFLALASGAQRKFSWLVVPLVLVNVVSLADYWYGDWAYADDLIDWRAVARWVGGYVTPQTMILTDGRAQGMTSYYFPHAWDTQGASSLASDDLGQLNYSRIVLLSYNFHADARAQMTAVMQRIANEYDETAVWSQYPLFVYAYDRKAGKGGAYSVQAASGRMNIPTEIYGLEFQDLRLPIQLSVEGHAVESDGAFGLPSLANQSARTLPLAQPTYAHKVWLLSNVTGAEPKPGAQVATLSIIGVDGSTQNIPLRAGFETNVWNGRCQPGACVSAFTWRKRLALLGSESYPGSWQEFDASIFVSELSLAQPTAIRDLQISRVALPGTLYVWGIVLQP